MELKDKVIHIFLKFEAFLKSDSFEEGLKNELEKCHPDYMKMLRKRRNDMEKSDHGIVIAGTCMNICCFIKTFHKPCNVMCTCV